MRDRNIELLRKVCKEMGIEWDDKAEGIEVNGKLMDKAMLDDLFLADNSYMVFGRCNDKPEPFVDVEECKKRLNEMRIKISDIEN